VSEKRTAGFYWLAALFALFVLFLYGPMIVIYVLSFQGPNGGMTFPLNGVSVHWFNALIEQQRTGDIAGAFKRSLALAGLVTVLTVVLAVAAGLALPTCRLRSFMSTTGLLYLAMIAILPGQLLGQLGWRRSCHGAVGADLDATSAEARPAQDDGGDVQPGGVGRRGLPAAHRLLGHVPDEGHHDGVVVVHRGVDQVVGRLDRPPEAAPEVDLPGGVEAALPVVEEAARRHRQWLEAASLAPQRALTAEEYPKLAAADGAPIAPPSLQW